MAIETKQYALRQKAIILACILLSGICWYFANHLSGNYWFLMWVAPVPVLLISFQSTGKQAFFSSFSAYLIGRMSWFTYLISVATLIPAIVFTVLLPLIFALIAIVVRKIVLKTNAWYAAFAFPVLFTFYEWLLIMLSTDGTAGSIAYSQAGFLPLIQIVSVTGIPGITFLVTLVPSAIATGLYHRSLGNRIRNIILPPFLTLILTIAFGVIRMNTGADESSVTAGLLVMDEKLHFISDSADFEKDRIVAESYGKAFSGLAAKGAELIVMPERAINMDRHSDSSILAIFTHYARLNHVTIIFGYTNYRGNNARNSSMALNSEGSVVSDYSKVHLVRGFEDQFTPGSKTGIFVFSQKKVGIPVCKDLDFPAYIREYGKSNVQLLCIPAWDFVKDDWLHSRMAILRGVENGFPEIRTARLGRLTISDCYGKVNFDESSSNGKKAELVGKVSLQNRNTVFTRFGNWFGIVNAIAAAIFIVSGFSKRRTMP